MILVGRYMSPFVRRVGITLSMLGLPFEHRSLSTLQDADAIRQYNPMGKVPILVLDSGEKLIESAAIIDAALEMVPTQTLLPAQGPARRQVLQNCGWKTSALEKAIQAMYEPMKRPPEKVHEPYLVGLRAQACAGLDMLEKAAARGELSAGEPKNLADITAAVGWRFLLRPMAKDVTPERYPLLAALSERSEKTPAFQACQPEG
jgi:glutathione S-transferase